MTQKKIGDVILDVKNISLRFGGVKALTDILQRARARDPRHHRPQRRGQELHAQLHQRRLHPAEGSITFRGKTFDHMNSRQVAEMGVAAPSRTWRCSRA
jgi:branched-chain amino acid transport system ATP-binding protein